MTRREIEKRIFNLEADLKAERQKLEFLERNCFHNWNAPILRQEYIPSRYIAGDPPSFQGVDKQFGFWTEPQTIKTWTRECANCGKIETTKKSKPVVSTTESPIF